MKPQKQLLRHKPAEGIFGDCYRTAIAIALDLDAASVPHFMDSAVSGDEASAKAEAWLNARGMTQLNILFPGDVPLQKILDSIAAVNQRARPVFLLTGTSRNGCAHVVVACNGDIVCDPAIDDSGIIGPCDDGFYWVTLFGHLAATDGAAKRRASARDRLDRAAGKLFADLLSAGLPSGSFYVTIGDGELHVYARAEDVASAARGPKVLIACDYPVEWHFAEVDVRPVGVVQAEAAE